MAPNLFLALKHFRYLEEPRVLWIDAICINQDGVPERGKQVQIMSKIYSKARRVIVWFGEEAPTDALAFDLLHRWYRRINSQGHDLDPLGEVLGDLVAEGRVPSFTALCRLLERRWFRRVWVIQEVVVATNTVATCGSLSMPWKVLQRRFTSSF